MALYTPEYKPNGKEIAVITTDEGTIRVQLHGEDAPIHVGNFVELAQKGFYDGLKFHRYVPGFVIQGGCPNTREMSAADVAAGKSGPDGMPGTGNPGYSIKGEWKTNPNNSHEDGTLAMARSSSSIPTTRSSVTPSRALTSSASFVPAASSRTSRSRTRTSRRTSTKGSLPS